jgi:hypothetical protein
MASKRSHSSHHGSMMGAFPHICQAARTCHGSCYCCVAADMSNKKQAHAPMHTATNAIHHSLSTPRLQAQESRTLQNPSGPVTRDTQFITCYALLAHDGALAPLSSTPRGARSLACATRRTRGLRRALSGSRWVVSQGKGGWAAQGPPNPPPFAAVLFCGPHTLAYEVGTGWVPLSHAWRGESTRKARENA